jgi:hypothetical protein
MNDEVDELEASNAARMRALAALGVGVQTGEELYTVVMFEGLYATLELLVKRGRPDLGLETGDLFAEARGEFQRRLAAKLGEVEDVARQAQITAGVNGAGHVPGANRQQRRHQQ